jgi:hypothetical protein
MSGPHPREDGVAEIVDEDRVHHFAPSTRKSHQSTLHQVEGAQHPVNASGPVNIRGSKHQDLKLLRAVMTNRQALPLQAGLLKCISPPTRDP